MITLTKLNSALSVVQGELIDLGFYDHKLAKIDIYLVVVGIAYGWQYYGSSGEICIPAVSISKLSELIWSPYTTLNDILIHEYAHAFAHTHKGLIKSKKFSEAFWAKHDADFAWEYETDLFVSEYAATKPSEDFAETFMFYVKNQGNRPKRFNSDALKTKWKFLDDLRKATKKGLGRF
ncbi:MAG: hypothetical protein KDC90_11910 [Ignavibacteriae bacterium]|nr:hypothetical protein [Ignavibacteriota bacterium]MCB9210939.1 hypothetical protein [Ignavibacteriales bacterium]